MPIILQYSMADFGIIRSAGLTPLALKRSAASRSLELREQLLHDKLLAASSCSDNEKTLKVRRGQLCNTISSKDPVAGGSIPPPQGHIVGKRGPLPFTSFGYHPYPDTTAR